MNQPTKQDEVTSFWQALKALILNESDRRGRSGSRTYGIEGIGQDAVWALLKWHVWDVVVRVLLAYLAVSARAAHLQGERKR